MRRRDRRRRDAPQKPPPGEISVGRKKHLPLAVGGWLLGQPYHRPTAIESIDFTAQPLCGWRRSRRGAHAIQRLYLHNRIAAEELREEREERKDGRGDGGGGSGEAEGGRDGE